MGAAAGYLDAKYRRFGIAPGNPVLEPIDLSGARMINSPEWQLSFSADLDQPLSDRIRLVGHAVASHTASTIWNYRGAAFLTDAVAPAYWLVNARLGLRLGGERFGLALFGKNLFNEAYTVYGSSSASSGTVLVWGEPRIIGLEGVLRF